MDSSSSSCSPLMAMSSEEDTLVKEVLQTHAPNGCHIDPMPLLFLTENTIRLVMASMISKTRTVANAAADSEDGIELVSKDKELGSVIRRISQKMLYHNPRDANKHETAMALLELVDRYAWNMKAVLVLAAVAVSYAEFALILQLWKNNPLASSILLLKQLKDISEKTKEFRTYFKSLICLVQRMINVTKCIIEFESLSPEYVTMDSQSMVAVRSYIHVAAYWIIRGAITCSYQITGMMAVKDKNLNFTIATWELWSLASKVDRIHGNLRKLTDACYLRVENKVQSLLSNLFQETYDNNQNVLTVLFALKDDFPLRDGFSKEKCSMAVLENKVVLLLISRPSISPEKLLLLIQQLSNNSDIESESCFEVVWIPIPRSSPHSLAEEKAINQLACALPWYSIPKPCSLSTAVVKYIKETWYFEEDPMIVVIDSKGKVTSTNAIHMVSIWGSMAYPFSTSKEAELWEKQRWSIELLMDEIDPIVSTLMEDSNIICLYGGSNIKWIKNLTSRMKDIIRSGVPLKLLYVGCNSTNAIEDILDTVSKERLSGYLTQTKISFFWSRLESMRKSRINLGCDETADHILKEIYSLTDIDAIRDGWLVISERPTSSIITLAGTRASELLSSFQVWGENVEKQGFLNSIRNVINPPQKIEHCGYSNFVPYADNDIKRPIMCKECGHPMKKDIMFQCKVEH